MNNMTSTQLTFVVYCMIAYHVGRSGSTRKGIFGALLLRTALLNLNFGSAQATQLVQTPTQPSECQFDSISPRIHAGADDGFPQESVRPGAVQANPRTPHCLPQCVGVRVIHHDYVLVGRDGPALCTQRGQHLQHAQGIVERSRARLSRCIVHMSTQRHECGVAK